MTPEKSLTLGPLAIPDEYFPDFFRGCIDGDGSIFAPEHLLVVTEPKAFETIRDGLKNGGLPDPHSAEVTMVPQTIVKLVGKDAEGAVKLVAALEDNDDVQNVYSNMDVDDAVLESVG